MTDFHAQKFQQLVNRNILGLEGSGNSAVSESPQLNGAVTENDDVGGKDGEQPVLKVMPI